MKPKHWIYWAYGVAYHEMGAVADFINARSTLDIAETTYFQSAAPELSRMVDKKLAQTIAVTRTIYTTADADHPEMTTAPLMENSFAQPDQLQRLGTPGPPPWAAGKSGGPPAWPMGKSGSPPAWSMGNPGGPPPWPTGKFGGQAQKDGSAWLSWTNSFFDIFPALNIHGGGDLPRKTYCESVSSAISGYVARTHFSLTSGQHRPTMTYRMPGPDSQEAAWLQCLPPPWSAKSVIGNLGAWGPGPAPVVSIIGNGPVPDWGYGGQIEDNSDEVRCGKARDGMANSISRVYESVKHSRLDNYNIGPRAGFPTVTIQAPRGPQASCIRLGVFSGGNIPGLWPRTAHAITTKVPAQMITPTPAPPYTMVSTVTIYATKTAWATPSLAANYPGPHLPKGLEVETSQIDRVSCRPYADLLTADWTKVNVLEQGTKLTVNCWTIASLPDELGSIQGSNVWLHVEGQDCWIHDTYLSTYIPDVANSLQFCLSPLHQVGTLQPQYSRQDCYDETSLDAPSRNVGSGSKVDVKCKTFGSNVQGNSTWVKSTFNCWIPGAVFESSGWLGTHLGLC